MSKTTLNTQFRRVDVDALDEENNFKETDSESASAGPDIAAAQDLLLRGSKADALKAILQNPPLKASKDLKDQVFAVALKILTAHKGNEVEKSVAGLTQQEIDTLVKYIYRGFAEAKDSSRGLLLTWHEKAIKAGGLGSIVRVLTSLKTV